MFLSYLQLGNFIILILTTTVLTSKLERNYNVTRKDLEFFDINHFNNQSKHYKMTEKGEICQKEEKKLHENNGMELKDFSKREREKERESFFQTTIEGLAAIRGRTRDLEGILPVGPLIKKNTQSEKISENIGLEKSFSEEEIVRPRSTLIDANIKKEKYSISIIQRKKRDKFVEPREEDMIQAANFGIEAMNELYYIKEPKLYSLGIFLGPNNPAHFVASFNELTEEAKYLSRFGFAALQGSILFVNKFPELSRNIPFAQSTGNSSLRQQCPKRGIPQCTPASLRYRTADGSCNNAQNPWWGSAMSTMQRILPPLYQDGIQSVRRSLNEELLPSSREVSNLIHEDRDISLASISHMLMQWGQFIDHDISASIPSRGFNGTIPQCCLERGKGFQLPQFMSSRKCSLEIGWSVNAM
ncbi:peroxidasin-like protein isoform X3 [Leptopilina heterotoma]|uniref:peroxidasin-like protein isoform X3 n=1 Tax=Leptopilina heterotoma TaxID=63436 RepID=UPI001CA936E7|nr:peroxidasin-like protein isoform X3 [Leptopilina heterotoma]